MRVTYLTDETISEGFEQLLKETQQKLEAANKRIDELIVIIHNLAQQLQTNGYNLLGTGYDMQTLGRIVNERFPLTGTQQELVNKSKKQLEQSS